MSHNAAYWASDLQSKGYRVESETSNNSPNRTLYTVYHYSYCKGAKALLGGILGTQLKALSVADSCGWARRNVAGM